jgi:transposase
MGLPALRAMIEAEIAQLSKLKAGLLARLIAALRADPARKARYQLLMSLPGIGQVVAASLLIRMPELGAMEHGQAASLIGVAPHARESGQHKGKRFIAGGRPRPRRMLYIAALSAKRYDPGFNAFTTRLANAGKPPKLIVIAVMRKLIEAANLVLKRGQTWKQYPA